MISDQQYKPKQIREHILHDKVSEEVGISKKAEVIIGCQEAWIIRKERPRSEQGL